MFHSRDGLYFHRRDDGSVLIALDPQHDGSGTEVVLEASAWASAVASVCARGEDGPTWRQALAFHEEARPT